VTAQPLDLAPIRARHTTASLGLDAVAPRQLTHDVGALLAALAEARADADRWETCATEAARDADDLPTREALIETIAAADDERDRLEAALEDARRRMTHGTTRRGCVALDCWTEFDLDEAAGAGRSAGWLQSTALGGYLCPTHGPALAEHATRWEPGRLVCGCGWTSPTVRHRGAGVEMWLDHAHEVIEGIAVAPPVGAEHYQVQVYELYGEWSSVGGHWPTEAEAVQDMRGRRRSRPDWPAMRVLRNRSWTERTVACWEGPEDITRARDASRAPESAQGTEPT